MATARNESFRRGISRGNEGCGVAVNLEPSSSSPSYPPSGAAIKEEEEEVKDVKEDLFLCVGASN